MDKAWRSKGAEVPIFLVFDALVVNSENLVAEHFSKRLTTAH